MVRFLSQLKPVNLKDKVCLLRLDFNTDDNWRWLASLPTLKLLTAHCQAVVILSHKGRPAGREKRLSLKRYAKDISRAIKKPVSFAPHFRFPEIKKIIQSSPKKSVFLLENLRFLKEEGDNSSALAKRLATLGDLYINDAFAVSHRANASISAITKFLPSFAGFELEAEIKNLSRVIKKPQKPLVVILGGLKIEDKLRVVKNLHRTASAFLIGGALNTAIIHKISGIGKLVLSEDFKYEKGAIRDIGPKSIKKFGKEILTARTIIWNGPAGDITKPKFTAGTKAIARAVTANLKSFKIVGGGETVAFLKKLKLDKKFDFVSTGGGAMLDFLAGKKLPGLEALKINKR
ncbi:MAG: phosphoglycerate kinase [bacterium]|nr:phosphoglycerate kinase [bacterium]